jgi:hypothetical protein
MEHGRRSAVARRARRLVAALLALLGLAAAGTGVAAASPSAGPTAIVSLGDSFISGEAGRWQGNSIVPAGDRAGTDRAWTGTGYDPARVYGTTDANGCHRSDVAEIRSAPIGVERKVNLACSGAVAANVFRSSHGGQGQNGEPPQADQLAAVAARDRVRLVALSIGGNDLGFADIITQCALRFTTKTGPCAPAQQAAVAAAMPAARAGVAKAIDEVRAVMRAAGYTRAQYRFVLQSYPSPVPRAAETRYPELGELRETVGGCPFYDADLTWARDSLVDQIADMLRGVAADRGVELLDLRDSLQGREACATASRQATLTAPPSPSTSEWARFLTSNLVQGEIQETLHPNAYGQQALGWCLGLAWGAGGGDGACVPTPGQGPAGMRYVRTRR